MPAESDAGSALQKAKEDSQPSVLDPVNPTNNVAATLPPGGWQELAARAEACTAWFKSPEGLQFLPASHATRQRLVSDGKQADGKLPDGNVRKKQLLHELCQKEGWVVRYDNRRLDLDPSQTSFVSTVEVGAKDVVEGEVSQKAHLCCEGEAAPSKQKAEASAAACVLARIKSDDEFALPKQPSTHAPGCCSHCSRGSKGAASNIESVGTSGAVAAASFASAALGADADADGHCGERHCDRELFFSALWKFLAGILVFSLMSGWLFACGLFRRDVR